MACRVLLFWVRHAALLRPLAQDGKLQVTLVAWVRVCSQKLEMRGTIGVGVHGRQTGSVHQGNDMQRGLSNSALVDK